MATVRQVIDGLTILAKYTKDEDGGQVCAEHDQIWAGPDLAENDVSADDRAALDALGWFYDEDLSSWSKFT